MKHSSSIFNSILYSIVKNSSHLCFASFFRLKITGLENIPKDDPVLVASNHCSNFDPVLVGSSFPRKIYYLAKEELFKPFLLGPLITALGAYPVSRNDSQRAGAVLKLLVSLINEGKSILLFPEGTRSVDGKLKPLEGGATFLSLRTGAPVLPVWVQGTLDAFPRGAKFPKLVPIEVRFGKPLYPDTFKSGAPSDKDARNLMLEALTEALLVLQGGKREGE